MKIKLEPNSFSLVPENYADQMYIAFTIRHLSKEGLTENIEAEFSFSKSRVYSNAPKGGGWLNPESLVDELYEAEQDETHEKKAVEEITELTVHLNRI